MTDKKEELIKRLTTKTFGNPNAVEPPMSLTAMMGRAREMVEHPDRWLKHGVELLQMDLEHAYDCLAAVGDAIEYVKPRLNKKRYRGPVPEELVEWRKNRRAKESESDSC